MSALFTLEGLTEKGLTEEQAAEVLIEQDALGSLAAEMVQNLNTYCYSQFSEAATSMRNSYVQVDLAYRLYLSALGTAKTANAGGGNRAHLGLPSVSFRNDDGWTYSKTDDKTTYAEAGLHSVSHRVHRTKVFTPNLLHVFEPRGTAEENGYIINQFRALDSLIRNMHETAAGFGAPLTTKAHSKNATRRLKTSNDLEANEAAVTTALSTLNVDEFSLLGVVDNVGATNQPQRVAAAASSVSMPMDAYSDDAQMCFKYGGNPTLTNAECQALIDREEAAFYSTNTRVIQTAVDFAGLLNYKPATLAANDPNGNYYGRGNVNFERSQWKHFPQGDNDGIDNTTFTNVYTSPNPSPTRPFLYPFIAAEGGGWSYEGIKEDLGGSENDTLVEALVDNFTANYALVHQAKEFPDLPGDFYNPAAHGKSWITTRDDGIPDDFTGTSPTDRQISVIQTNYVNDAKSDLGPAGTLDGLDISDDNYLTAQTSLLYNGTFNQMHRTLQHIAASPNLHSKFSREYKEALGHMITAGANFNASLTKLHAAWSCAREKIMPYTTGVFELKQMIEEFFGDNSTRTAWLMGWLPGIDSITNTGLMNDLINQVDQASISSRIAAAVQKNIFKEQCFLLSYMKKLSQIKKARDSGPAPTAPRVPGAEPKKFLPYKGNPYNSSLLLDGDPYALINKLTQGESSSGFFNVNPEVISHLQPMIRLYKVTYDDDGDAYEDEFIFESSAVGLEAMLQDKKRRGAGVGVQSFNFAYEGSNPFAVKKSISATLKVFASSMDELLEPRKSSNNRDIAFADLALKTRNPPPPNAQGQSQTPGAAPAACSAPASSAPPSNLSATQNANLDKLTFRLKAVVGWALPNGNGPWEAIDGGVVPQNEKELIYSGICDSSITLNLTPTVHSFEFDDLGRTVMSINYLAYVDDFYDQPAFNIFANPDPTSENSATAKQLVRNMLLKHYTETCTADVLSTVKENMAENVNLEKQQILQSLVTSLSTQEKIYTLRLARPDISKFLSSGPFQEWDPGNAPFDINLSALSTNSDTAAAEMQEALDSYEGFSAGTDATKTALFTTGLAAASPYKETLPFIFVSDLVDCIMENIEKEIENLPDQLAVAISNNTSAVAANLSNSCRLAEEQQRLRKLQASYKKLRIVLGPLEVVDQSEAVPANVLHCTFGDVPIALKYFLEWMTEQMVGQDQTIYSLTRFINDLFNKLIQDFLNDGSCFSWDIKPGGKVRVSQTVITSYPRISATQSPSTMVDELTQFIGSGSPRLNIDAPNVSRPLLRISGVPEAPIQAGKVSEEMNYFVFSAGRVAPIDQMNGNKEEDEEKGIYHYMIGRNKGLIKTIKLNKTDSQGLAEVRFEQEGYEGLEQLRVLYDADIDMYSNVKTFPGTYIFVDPRGFAPTTNLDCGDPMNLTQYGVGGYMMIIKSEHSFGPGKAETKLHAKWVNGISNCAGTQDSNLPGVANPTNQGNSVQCQGELTSARQTSANSTTP